jgi:hypothetical protein
MSDPSTVVVLGEVQRVEAGSERGLALLHAALHRLHADLRVVATRRRRPRLVDCAVVADRHEDLDLHSLPLASLNVIGSTIDRNTFC